MSKSESAGLQSTGTETVPTIDGPFREPYAQGGEPYFRCSCCDAEAADRTALESVSVFHDVGCSFV
ncbi:hypothetical protein [Haloprofundus marisrubri]|uniref:hypothetical protein n=1 Tax=Haloprofundus marisrubri TaxID=1514971 RepID=UPI0012BAC849|nr:hypothetical protein [Haloprofundus marisrubri]